MLKRSYTLFLALLPLLLMAKSNTIKEIDSLLQLSREYKFKVEIEQAIEVAHLALTKSIEIDYSQGKAAAYLNLAQTLLYLGSYEKSLNYLSLTEDEPHSSDNLYTMFEISRIRGQIFSYMKLEEQSIHEFHKCISLTNRFDDKQQCKYGLSLSYENLAVVYNKIGKLDSAFYFINKNKELLESMDESYIYRSLVNLYSTLGNRYITEGEYELARENLNKAFNLAEKYQYCYLSRTLIYMGDLHAKNEKGDSALYYYHKALNNLETTKIKGEYSVVYNKLSTFYQDAGEVDSARIYKEKELLIDAELSDERGKSIGKALNVFLNEERKVQQQQKSKAIFFISITLLVFVSIVSIFWIKTKNKFLERKKKLRAELNHTMKEFEEIEKETHLLEKKVNQSFDEIIDLAKNNSPTFLKRFQEVYPEHSKSLLQKHPNLTNSELILCALIYLKFSTKDISTYTFVEHRSVQTKKSRLRKKLQLPAGANITNYLNSLNGL